MELEPNNERPRLVDKGEWGRSYMRLLIWHMDEFVAEPTERGRSSVADPEPKTVRVADALVVFAAVEKKDEADRETTAERAAAAIAQVAKQLGVRTVVLHSFSHLFVELSTPMTAQHVLGTIQTQLEAESYNVEQTAFGWFNRLDMKAKGHPLSRVARQV